MSNVVALFIMAGIIFASIFCFGFGLYSFFSIVTSGISGSHIISMIGSFSLGCAIYDKISDILGLS